MLWTWERGENRCYIALYINMLLFYFYNTELLVKRKVVFRHTDKTFFPLLPILPASTRCDSQGRSVAPIP